MTLKDRMEATWPPLRKDRRGDWWLRQGAGGGQRVSAASPAGPRAVAELDGVIAAMSEPLFLLDAADTAVDQALAARGFVVHDPVVILAADPAVMAGQRVHVDWPVPDAVQGLWALGKVGEGRLAVMGRVQGQKAALWIADQGEPVAVGFCGMKGDFAGVHAVFVAPHRRGQGLGRRLMQGIARWAVDQGARQMALAVTTANRPARQLYARLGMDEIGASHYRKSPEDLAEAGH
jgi:GNAT superfamily N-acetyltransferase